MLIIKWVSQRGPWMLLFNTHKSHHHLLMECASGYTSYPDLGKPKFRAHKAFFASQSLRMQCRVHKECFMKGTTFLFHLDLDRTITPSPLFLTLKGKTEYSVRMFCLWSRFLVSTWFFDSWRSYNTFHQLRIWSVVFCDTTTIKKVSLSCFSSCS